MLREHASWVSFAAVLMLTVGTGDPARYALSYAGLTLLGAAIGVLGDDGPVPAAAAHLRRPPGRDDPHAARPASAGHLGRRSVTGACRRRTSGSAAARTSMPRWTGCGSPRASWSVPGGPTPGHDAGATARRASANSPARWTASPSSSTTSRCWSSSSPPHRRGIDQIDGGAGWVLADALEGLARVVCTPYPTGGAADAPDDRDAAIDAADAALQRLTTLLRTSDVADDEGFFALGAVTVGMYRSLDTLRGRPRSNSVA